MPRYKVSQYVDAPNSAAAHEYANRMTGVTTVTVPVAAGPPRVETYTPIYEPEYSGLDRVVKHAIVAVVLYYVGNSLKKWAKK